MRIDFITGQRCWFILPVPVDSFCVAFHCQRLQDTEHGLPCACFAEDEALTVFAEQTLLECLERLGREQGWE